MIDAKSVPIKRSSAFALPTVLIAATILLIVLTVAMATATSISVSLRNVYYQQLAREAAESGILQASTCLSVSSTIPWDVSTKVLVPSSSCSGVAKSNPPACSAAKNSVVKTDAICSTYVVTSVVSNSSSGPPYAVNVSGRTDLLRANGSVAASRTVNLSQLIRYSTQPTIAGGAGWKSSSQHSGYMLSPSGVLYGWGGNSEGQIVSPSGGIKPLPVKIELPSGATQFLSVANAGQGATILCAVVKTTASGNQVYCRGSGLSGQVSGGWTRFGLSGGLTAKDVKVNGYGNDSVCVLASDNQLYCAGINDRGNLGAGLTSSAPVPIDSPVQFNIKRINSSLTVKEFYVQDVTTCVIASDNNAYCAGRNELGQLGSGSATTDINIGSSWPLKVAMPSGVTVDNISLPYHASSADGVFFHGSDNQWYMSGNNSLGTANDGAFSGSCSESSSYNCYLAPKKLTSSGFPTMLSIGEDGAGRHGVCVVRGTNYSTTSDVYCMGSNKYGQLGTGTCDDVNKLTVLTIKDESGTTVHFAPASGSYTTSMLYQMNATYLLAPNGDLYAAGDNTYGKLGITSNSAGTNCSSTSNSTFKRVQMPAGVKVVDFTATDQYTTYILGSDNRVYALGGNEFGQLGNGTTDNSSSPQPVALPTQSILY